MEKVSHWHRGNARALPWLRALLIAAITLVGARYVPFYPAVAAPAFALGTAALSLFAPAIAVMILVVIVSLPLVALDFAGGIAFLVLGLAASQYLSQDNARSFLVIAGVLLASMFDAAWAVVAVAGFGLGASEGAVVALLACLAAEALGFSFGRETVGVVASGASAAPLFDISLARDGVVVVGQAEYSSLGFGWIGPAVSSFNLGDTISHLSGIKDVGILLSQPVIWAISAGVAGSIVKQPGDNKRLMSSFLSVTAGVAALFLGSLAAMEAFSGPVDASRMLVAAAASLAIALVFVAASEFVFAPIVIERVRGSMSLQAEDADVDELLRVISNAEDALAAKHTVNSAVLITDMKSFSHMTELDGSVLTAKSIQRHRDLLLPVVSKHDGSGKSTGGDGLLAAFDRPGDAVQAAVDMQRVLEAFYAEHASERPISIRIGIAFGEVVVDKHGRPFIGDALNRAARTMNLADGGQIFATGDVLDRTPAAPPAHSHGQHKVRNIADPIDVREVLWKDGQEPKPPRKEALEARAEGAH